MFECLTSTKYKTNFIWKPVVSSIQVQQSMCSLCSISSLPNILSILIPVPQNILLFVSMHSRALLKQLTRPHGMYATFCIDSLVLCANGNELYFLSPRYLTPIGKANKILGTLGTILLAATEDFSK